MIFKSSWSYMLLLWYAGGSKMCCSQLVDPEWWPLIEATHEGPQLDRCNKRDGIRKPLGPPPNGQRCARIPKACYFDDQLCGTTLYPATRCICSGRTWQCEPASCPSDLLTFAPVVKFPIEEPSSGPTTTSPSPTPTFVETSDNPVPVATPPPIVGAPSGATTAPNPILTPSPTFQETSDNPVLATTPPPVVGTPSGPTTPTSPMPTPTPTFEEISNSPEPVTTTPPIVGAPVAPTTTSPVPTATPTFEETSSDTPSPMPSAPPIVRVPTGPTTASPVPTATPTFEETSDSPVPVTTMPPIGGAPVAPTTTSPVPTATPSFEETSDSPVPVTTMPPIGGAPVAPTMTSPVPTATPSFEETSLDTPSPMPSAPPIVGAPAGPTTISPIPTTTPSFEETSSDTPSPRPSAPPIVGAPAGPTTTSPIPTATPTLKETSDTPSPRPSAPPIVGAPAGPTTTSPIPTATPTFKETSDTPSPRPSAPPIVGAPAGPTTTSPIPTATPTFKETSDAPSPMPSAPPSKAEQEEPSISIAPSATPSKNPSVSAEPSVSQNPSLSISPSGSPSNTPSLSPQPSSSPSVSQNPSASVEPSKPPSVSQMPSVSVEPSNPPTVSYFPTISMTTLKPSDEPSAPPSESPMPSESDAPSDPPSESPMPSVSNEPTLSKDPTCEPTESLMPTMECSEPPKKEDISEEEDLGLADHFDPVTLSSNSTSSAPMSTLQPFEPVFVSFEEGVGLFGNKRASIEIQLIPFDIDFPVNDSMDGVNQVGMDALDSSLDSLSVVASIDLDGTSIPVQVVKDNGMLVGSLDDPALLQNATRITVSSVNSSSTTPFVYYLSVVATSTFDTEDQFLEAVLATLTSLVPSATTAVEISVLSRERCKRISDRLKKKLRELEEAIKKMEDSAKIDGLVMDSLILMKMKSQLMEEIKKLIEALGTGSTLLTALLTPLLEALDQKICTLAILKQTFLARVLLLREFCFIFRTKLKIVILPTLGASYSSCSGEIRLSKDFIDDKFVILHEYGHATHHEKVGDAAYKAPGRMRAPTRPELSSDMTATLEGWADFFAALNCKDPSTTITVGGSGTIEVDIENGVYSEDLTALRRPKIDDATVMEGKGMKISELGVSSFLWDLVDGGNMLPNTEDDDEVSLDPATIFMCMCETPISMKSFLKCLCCQLDGDDHDKVVALMEMNGLTFYSRYCIKRD